MTRSGARALALALITGCASLPRAPDEGGPTWISVETPNFSLVTDSAAEPAGELVGDLESWWQAIGLAMSSVLGQDSGRPALGHERLLVIALRSRWEREAVHYFLGGVFQGEGLVPPVVSIGDIDDEGGVETLKHELAHALLRERLPRVPRWFNEGLAVYLQTAAVHPKRSLVEWGMLSISETRDWSTLGPLVGVNTLLDAHSWGGGRDTAPLEIRAGLLVHMLINRHPLEVGCYVRHLETDIDPEAALGCFSTRASWPEELSDYSFSLSYKTRTAPFSPQQARPVVSRLSNASVHAVLAELDRMVLFNEAAQFWPERQARIRHHLTRALELEPGQLLAGLIVLHDEAEGSGRRPNLTKTLVDAHPEDWRAWIRRAQQEGLDNGEMRRAIARARELAPEQMEVIRMIAFEAGWDASWSDALRFGTQAWVRGGSDLPLRALLAISAMELGRCTEAQQWATVRPSEAKRFASVRAQMEPQPDGTPSPCGAGLPEAPGPRHAQ